MQQPLFDVHPLLEGHKGDLLCTERVGPTLTWLTEPLHFQLPPTKNLRPAAMPLSTTTRTHVIIITTTTSTL
jgi:hypothetical protein